MGKRGRLEEEEDGRWRRMGKECEDEKDGK
jgi:hypothetical protein